MTGVVPEAGDSIHHLPTRPTASLGVWYGPAGRGHARTCRGTGGLHPVLRSSYYGCPSQFQDLPLT